MPRINNYESAINLLKGRERKKLCNNTYAHKEGENVVIRLHGHGIIIYTPDNVILDSCGWKTNTTKDRLNTYSPIRINQLKGFWYTFQGLDFYDGITFDYQGNIVSINPNPDKKQENQRILKLISAYCREVKKLDKLPLPDNGDCWVCAGIMGEKSSCLLSHLEEKYIHGSLILNALKHRGYKNPGLIFNYRDMVIRALRKYFKDNLIK